MATITVTNLNDSGAGSLRAALASSAAGDTISFAAGLSGGVLRLTSGPLSITKAVTIDGDLDNDGRPDITISGDTNGDDVHIAGSTTITDVNASLAAGMPRQQPGSRRDRAPADRRAYNAATGADGAWVMSPGQVGGWLANPVHDALEPVGAGRYASTIEEVVWYNPSTGALVTY